MVRLAGLKALNLEATAQVGEQQKVTREAEQSRLVRAYQKALRQIKGGEDEAAAQALRGVLAHPLLREAWHSRSKKLGLSASAPLADLERLLYLTLKNLADLEAAAPTNETRRRMVVALYSDALSVDESDPLVWLRLATKAGAGGARGVARGAFEQGLKLHTEHPLLLQGLLHLTVELGDVDAAMATARRLHNVAPGSADAARVLALQPGPPAELLQLLRKLSEGTGAPGAQAAWPDPAELQWNLHERTLQAALPLVLHQEALPSVAARLEDEGRMEVGEGGEEGEASVIAMVEGTCGHERLKVELTSLDWTCLASQVAHCLEWIASRGTKRLKLAKTLRGGPARKGSQASKEGLISLSLIQQATDAAQLADAEAPPADPDQDTQNASDAGAAEEAPSALVGGAQPALERQDSAMRSDEDTECAGKDNGGRSSAEGGAADDAAMQQLVRPKKRATGALPEEIEAAAAAAAAEAEAAAAAAEAQAPPPRREYTLSDWVVRPALLNKPIKVLFRGAALAAAQPHLSGDGGVEASEDEHGPDASEVSAGAKRARSETLESVAPRKRLQLSERPGSESARGTPEPSARGGGGGGGARAARVPLSRRQRAAVAGADAEDAGRPVDAAEAQHRRNVMHALGPAVLADSGLGPAAVRSPDLEQLAPDGATAPPGTTDAPDAATNGFRGLPPPLDVMMSLRAEAAGDHFVMRVGIFQLAQTVLSTAAATGGPHSHPRPLLDALRSLDSVWHGELDAGAHLFYAELAMEQAAEAARLHHTAAAGRAGKRACGAAKRPRSGDASLDGRAAASADKPAKDAAAALKRATAHLAAFRMRCVECGGAGQAAASCIGGDRLAIAADWALRAEWLAHRLAAQQGDPTSALEHLSTCRDMLTGAEQHGLSHVAGSAPVVSLAAVDDATHRLRFSDLLANLPDELERRGHRAVFRAASTALFGGGGATSALLFPSGTAHSQALSKLFAALMTPAAAMAPFDTVPAAGGAATPGATSPETRVATSASASGAMDGDVPAAVGDLTESETLWLRATFGFEYLRTMLPVERTVAKAAHLPTDSATATDAVLGAGAERTGTLQGPRATRPRFPEAPSKAPTERATRALTRVSDLAPALLKQVAAAAGTQELLPRNSDATGDAPAATAPEMLQRLQQGRLLDLAGVKAALLAFLEVVYWGQQDLATEVPAQPAAALTAPAEEVTERMQRDVDLNDALRHAQHLASCSLLLVHAVQATALRSALQRKLAALPRAAAAAQQPAAALEGTSAVAARRSPRRRRRSDAGDAAAVAAEAESAPVATPVEAPAATADTQAQRLQIAGAMRASIEAELTALQAVHLLLNDRNMTGYAAHGALKLALERLKSIHADLQWLRRACHEDLDAGGTASASGSEEEAEAQEESGEERQAGKGGAAAITLAALVEAGLLQPGEGVLTVLFKGRQWPGDLLQDGNIGGNGQTYTNPTRFALTKIQQVVPSRSVSNGWEVISYDGKTLSQWRAELAAQRDETQRLEEAEAGGTADASSAAAAAAAEVARQARLKELRENASQQRALEASADAALAKCLYTVFGVELERGVADSDWGGVAPARVARSSMDTHMAVEVFGHVAGELRAALAAREAGTGPGRQLARHRSVLERLLRDFPRPPAEVQALWGTVVGPLLTDSAGISPDALLAMPHSELLRHLRPPSEAPADARTTAEDAEVHQVIFHAACLLATNGERKGALQRDPDALLRVGGRGRVEEGAERLTWALLYSPRSLTLWREAALYYEAAADSLLSEAVAHVNPEEWHTDARGAARRLLDFCVERSVRAWAVCARLAEGAVDRAQALMGVLQNHWAMLQSVPPLCGMLRKQARTAEFVARLAAARGVAERLTAPDMSAALWQLGVGPWTAFVLLAKALRKQDSVLNAPHAMQAFATAAQLARAANSCALDTLYALHAHRIKQLLSIAPATTLACVARLHQQPLLPDAAVLPAVLHAAAEAAPAKDASGADVANCLSVVASACFLPPVAWRFHGDASTCPDPTADAQEEQRPAAAPVQPPPDAEMGTELAAPAQEVSLTADVPLSGGGGSRSGLRARPPRAITSPAVVRKPRRAASLAAPTPELAAPAPAAPANTPPDRHAVYSAPLSRHQQLCLLLYDAVAAMRWCTQAEPGFHYARGRLAAFFEAAGAPTAARAELNALLSTDAGKFSPEAVKDCSGGGARRLDASEAPVAVAALPPLPAQGLRPAAPLGKHPCAEPLDPKFAAAVRGYLRRYVALCRTTGAVGEHAAVVEWGLATGWGAASPKFTIHLGDFSGWTLGSALLDVAAELVPRELAARATPQLVLSALTKHIHTVLGADPCASCSLASTAPQLKGAVPVPQVAEGGHVARAAAAVPPLAITRLRALLLQAWKLHLALSRCSGGAGNRWATDVAAAVADAKRTAQQAPQLLGGRVNDSAEPVVTEAIFCALARAHVALLGSSNSCGALESAIGALKKASPRSAALRDLARTTWDTYLAQLHYRHACLLASYEALRGALQAALGGGQRPAASEQPAARSSPAADQTQSARAAAAASLSATPPAAAPVQSASASPARGSAGALAGVSASAAEHLLRLHAQAQAHLSGAARAAPAAAARPVAVAPAQPIASAALARRTSSTPAQPAAPPARFDFAKLAKRVTGEHDPLQGFVGGALRRRQVAIALGGTAQVTAAAAALLTSAVKAARTAREAAWKDIVPTDAAARIARMHASLLALLARLHGVLGNFARPRDLDAFQSTPQRTLLTCATDVDGQLQASHERRPLQLPDALLSQLQLAVAAPAAPVAVQSEVAAGPGAGAAAQEAEEGAGQIDVRRKRAVDGKE